MSEFVYQTLQVEDRLPISGGPSQHGQALGASVKLSYAAATALGDLAISYQANQALKKMSADITKQMPRSGGVLICVRIAEWSGAGEGGYRSQMLHAIFIAGSGTDPILVLKRYLSEPNITPGVGANEGWRARDVYTWVTAK